MKALVNNEKNILAVNLENTVYLSTMKGRIYKSIPSETFVNVGFDAEIDFPEDIQGAVETFESETGILRASDIYGIGSCNNLKIQKCPHEHNSILIDIGRLIPTHKAQAKRVAQKGIAPDIMNMGDVEIIEAMMNKNGFAGQYKYTRSRNYVRLINYCDWHTSLKKEFNV